MKKYIASLIIFTFFVIFGYKNKILFFSNSPVFYTPPSEINYNLNFNYKDVSSLLSIPNSILNDDESVSKTRISKGIFVVDLNGDGFDDVVFLYQNQNSDLKFASLINNKDGTFKFDQNAWGLNSFEINNNISTVAFADLNNSGRKDVIIGLKTGEVLIGKNLGSKFLQTKKIQLMNSSVRSINFFEFKKDGFLDILISSCGGHRNFDNTTSFIRDSNFGEAILLKNFKNLEFKPIKFLNSPFGGCGLQTLVTDFNGNNVPKIFFTADYGLNAIYQLDEKGIFNDITSEALGQYRSNVTMGVEGADLFAEGKTSIYLSDSETHPGLTFGKNALYYNISSPNELKFKNIAIQTKTDNCGLNYSSLFLDPSRTGKPDLLSFNTPFVRPSFLNWYVKALAFIDANNLFPLIINEFYHDFPPIDKLGEACFFHNNGPNQKWDNILVPSGLNGFGVAMTGAVFDLKNDGSEDLLIQNLFGKPQLYKLNYIGKNPWLGVKLVGHKSNRDGIGAKVLVQYNNLDKQLKLVNFRIRFDSQSSDNLIFGFQNYNNKGVTIIITWPSGIEQKINITKLNQYYTIEEI